MSRNVLGRLVVVLLVLCPINFGLLAPPLPSPPALASPPTNRNRGCAAWSTGLFARVRGGAAGPLASGGSGAEGANVSAQFSSSLSSAQAELADKERRIEHLLAKTAELEAEKACAMDELRQLHAANRALNAPPRDDRRVHKGREPSWWHPAQVQEWLGARPIGRIMTSFPDKNGTPRQGSVAPASRARLEIEFGNNPEHSLSGLLEFSHVWLLFLFHENGRPTPPPAKVKPPRLDGATKGVFATRAPHRPNPIGLSLCKLDGIEGHVLQLSGVDLVDGTPILDIKPFIPSYDTPPPHEEVRYPLWSSPEAHELIQVHLSDTASADLRMLKESRERPRLASTWEQAVEGLSQVLAADPRSVYRRQKCADDLYPVHYDRLNAWCVRPCVRA